jgi:hypothetical protein
VNQLQKPCKTEWRVQKDNVLKELTEEQLVQSSGTKLYMTYLLLVQRWRFSSIAVLPPSLFSLEPSGRCEFLCCIPIYKAGANCSTVQCGAMEEETEGNSSCCPAIAMPCCRLNSQTTDSNASCYHHNNFQTGSKATSSRDSLENQ